MTPTLPFRALSTLAALWYRVLALADQAVSGLDENGRPTILDLQTAGLVEPGRLEVTALRAALVQAWAASGLSDVQQRMVLSILVFEQGEEIPAIFTNASEHIRTLARRFAPNEHMLPVYTRAVLADKRKRARGAASQRNTLAAITALPQDDWLAHIWQLANSALRLLLKDVIKYDHEQHRGLLKARAKTAFYPAQFPVANDYACLLVYVIARARLGAMLALGQLKKLGAAMACQLKP